MSALKGTGWMTKERLQVSYRRRKPGRRCIPPAKPLQRLSVPQPSLVHVAQGIPSGPLRGDEDGRHLGLTPEDLQPTAGPLCHDDGSLAAKPHLSVRAQQRAVQKEKDALALAQFGKPYRELEHQKKLMMSKLWSKEPITLHERGRVAVSHQPGPVEAEGEEERIFRLRLHYLAQQEQGAQDRVAYQASWQQERNELALERFGVTWDDLPPQNRVLVAAHMRKNHQTSVSDRVLAQEAHKQQRLQAISLERFGKAYADLEWKDKTFVVQIWRWGNPLRIPPPQHQSSKEQQLQSKQDREDVSRAVLGRPWASLTRKEQGMISAHIRYGLKDMERGGRQEAEPSLGPHDAEQRQGQDRLATIKLRITQALQEQQATQERRAHLALQFYGKPWDALSLSEKTSLSVRSGKLKALNVGREDGTLFKSPHPEGHGFGLLPHKQKDLTREDIAQLFFGTSFEQLSSQQKRSVNGRLSSASPESIKQQRLKLQMQEEKDHMSKQLFGRGWDALNSEQRRSVASRVSWQKRKGSNQAPGTTRSSPLAEPREGITGGLASKGPCNNVLPHVHGSPPAPTNSRAAGKAAPGPARSPNAPGPPNPGPDSVLHAPVELTISPPASAPIPTAAVAQREAAAASRETLLAEEASLRAKPVQAPAESSTKRERAQPAPAPTRDLDRAAQENFATHAAAAAAAAADDDDDDHDDTTGRRPSSATSADPLPTAQIMHKRGRKRVQPQLPQNAGAGAETKAPVRNQAQGREADASVGDERAADLIASRAGYPSSSPTPEPPDVSGMLNRLKELQGLGAKIQLVLARLKGNRNLYERLPPERFAERDRYFQSLDSAKASLAHVAQLEAQLLQGIHHSSGQNGR